MSKPRFKSLIGITKWSADEDNTLIAFVEQGLSYAVIGQKMGYTKNKVIGRAWRLGLCVSRTRKIVVRKPLPLPTPELYGCSFPHGDPGTVEFYYCNKDVKPGSSYCESHHAVCWHPIKKKKIGEEKRRFVLYDFKSRVAV